MTDERAKCGWESEFPEFRDTSANMVREQLESYVTNAGQSQVRAWDDSIPKLQNEVNEILLRDQLAAKYVAILEYELPMDLRRPDVILLIAGAVVVLELKGKVYPSQADLDQVAAYARDLRCYHRECSDCPVFPILVPTRAVGYVGCDNGIHIAGPDYLDRLIDQLDRPKGGRPLSAARFLAAEAYRPLPTLVQAARELFHSRTIRTIHRARALTDPAIEEIARIIYDAARTRTRRLVLLTGVPGAGKTLVGLQAVHAHFLDDLSIERSYGKPTAPAVFLSGNGPLVEVLQYELRKAGGNGQTFVRGVFDYVRRYSSRPDLVPPEHVLVFDEAQRAFDAEQVHEKHGNTPGFTGGKSEPEHFIEFAERVPEWCVVIGLIGSGQEIHVGEEGGLGQWRKAVEGCKHPDGWAVHLPPGVASHFGNTPVEIHETPLLSLDQEIRFHFATDLHQLVAQILKPSPSSDNRVLVARLEEQQYHLRITRDLETAKAYLRERYAEQPEARFGILASSKDKDLERFDVRNSFGWTKQVRIGPWFGDGENEPGYHSCRYLRETITEFQAQGLELDATLLAWGTDLLLRQGRWSNAKARGYRQKNRVRDPFQLRLNAYRVLLTRGRDATVIFVPSLQELDETAEYLIESGIRQLG